MEILAFGVGQLAGANQLVPALYLVIAVTVLDVDLQLVIRQG